MAKRDSKDKPARPLYQQTADRLGEMLAEKSPGSFLPAEPELAKQMGVSRSTLREAMRLFEARGQVVRRRGVGTYVARPPHVIESGLEVLSSIETLASQIGVDLESSDLDIRERPAGEQESGWLGISADSPIVELTRVIQADGRPVAYFIDCLPREYLAPEDVDDSFTGSVLSLLLERGWPPLDKSQAEITAKAADGDIAAGLGVKPGDVLLHLEARLLAEDGAVVDHSQSYFLPGTFRFSVVRRVQHTA